jgi:anti-anti-sigma regulatory factor
MADDVYPVQWGGSQAVVVLPEQIDVSNAGPIREELLSVINRGATSLIADMTATISCDHSGAEAIVRATRGPTPPGRSCGWRVAAQIVRRVLDINGLDRLVSIYPSLDAASAADVPAPILALVAGIAAEDADRRAPLRTAGPIAARLRLAHPPDGNGRPSPRRWSGSWSTPCRTAWRWQTHWASIALTNIRLPTPTSRRPADGCRAPLVGLRRSATPTPGGWKSPPAWPRPPSPPSRHGAASNCPTRSSPDCSVPGSACRPL